MEPDSLYSENNEIWNTLGRLYAKGVLNASL